MKKSFSVRELSMDAIAYAINLAVGGGWKITGAEVCGDTLYVWAENQKIPECPATRNNEECRSCKKPLTILKTDGLRQEVFCKHCGEFYWREIPEPSGIDIPSLSIETIDPHDYAHG